MTKRIPPKGTPGYRLYWADRKHLDELKNQRDAYERAAADLYVNRAPVNDRWDMYFSVYQSLDEAVKMFEALHKEFNYFGLNS
jgi:hypothetical protein